MMPCLGLTLRQTQDGFLKPKLNGTFETMEKMRKLYGIIFKNGASLGLPDLLANPQC